MIETGVFAAKSQTGGYARINPSDGIPGDIAGGIPWVWYDDPEFKTFNWARLPDRRPRRRRATHHLLSARCRWPSASFSSHPLFRLFRLF